MMKNNWKQSFTLFSFTHKGADYVAKVVHEPGGSRLYFMVGAGDKGWKKFKFIDEDEFVTAHRIATRCWERTYRHTPLTPISYADAAEDKKLKKWPSGGIAIGDTMDRGGNNLNSSIAGPEIVVPLSKLSQFFSGSQQHISEPANYDDGTQEP